MARHLHDLTGERALCLAGGVALNCVANGRLLREGPFERIWIQPAAGDAGGALGAALTVWHQVLGNDRHVDGRRDAMQGARLGPSFDGEVEEFLTARGYPHRRLEPDQWAGEIAGLLAGEQVVGVCEGRMEYGPRALGGRSILGDPRSPRMQSVMNLKIKFRESFRPFAPAVRREDVADWFELDVDSPYMLLVAPVKAERRCAGVVDDPEAPLRERIHAVRSEIPAVTHVDGSARVQTVEAENAPRFHALLTAFKERTGCPVLINTSFNVRGEPIVCTPEDAYRCFMRTEMDALVLGDYLLLKAEQPAWSETVDWRREHVLD
jgi:carbamoyltransferase